ncbi:MAG TPA: hypothetical protein VGZ72_12275 [Stellaceae bacterium]|jgi:hypothetical protein|nr:hypothetical protein [Stellaceae bacterium]
MTEIEAIWIAWFGAFILGGFVGYGLRSAVSAMRRQRRRRSYLSET